MSAKALYRKVCVVTGASRGIGKGIALQLGEHGAKVYITERTLEPRQVSQNLGSLRQTEAEIKERGGLCVPVRCDHANDADVKNLFVRFDSENNGRLDILVNNAWGAVDSMLDNFGLKFWEMPISVWDDNNASGLHNSYICAVYAAKLMTKRKRGLIVNVSSSGGLHKNYSFNVPYGVGKEGCDRMAVDCGRELKDNNVTFISLWPGSNETEQVVNLLRENPCEGLNGNTKERRMKGRGLIKAFSQFETTELSGKCIVALAQDDKIIKKTGRIYTTFDLCREYGLKDNIGYGPSDVRSVKQLLQLGGYMRTAKLVPSFVRIPKWVLAQAGNKFG